MQKALTRVEDGTQDAAASWDQFRSYAQRGDLFAAAAARLVEAAGA